jgi:hypothetical protein
MQRQAHTAGCRRQKRSNDGWPRRMTAGTTALVHLEQHVPYPRRYVSCGQYPADLAFMLKRQRLHSLKWSCGLELHLRLVDGAFAERGTRTGYDSELLRLRSVDGGSSSVAHCLWLWPCRSDSKAAVLHTVETYWWQACGKECRTAAERQTHRWVD